MSGDASVTIVVLSKIVLWIAVVIGSVLLLRTGKLKPRVRTVFLLGGTLIFGFVYGIITHHGSNPSPVLSLRGVLFSVLVRRSIALPMIVLLAVLFAMGLVSNKSLCGWGCQFGLLQDLVHRIRSPKWKPPFRLSNTVRFLALGGLVAGLLALRVDWIGKVDPFRIFQIEGTVWMLLFFGGILATSIFIYRPWCQFLCPYGLVSWFFEQASLLKPRINPQNCKKCSLCAKACPTHAMSDFLAGKRLHADCFACGACITACPKPDALSWKANI